ncbi:MAG: class I SAM-dependent methyltransferase [Roseovarius sp.]|jgi:ubiquinone/menaquinone biosynthesis C-methylase UbiE|nr:class I SAM-dependent methyltransferase [Roseovarius sp.]
MTHSSADFWNKVARRYANMTIRNPEGYEATLDQVRSHLRPDDQVLELGCGTGTTALKLGGLVKQYVACDYAAEMITIANEKKSQDGDNAPEFLMAQTCDGSLPSGPFDAVLAFNVLHLLSDTLALLGHDP